MKRTAPFLGLFLLLAAVAPLQAGQTLVEAVRIWAAPDHTRLVLDTDGPVEHKIFSLNSPDRLVVDVEDARLDASLPKPGADARLVSRIRSASRNGDDLRAGRLVRLFDRAVEGSMSYFALTTEAAARKPKVIAFRDWLVEEGRAFTHGPAALPPDVPLT